LREDRHIAHFYSHGESQITVIPKSNKTTAKTNRIQLSIVKVKLPEIRIKLKIKKIKKRENLHIQKRFDTAQLTVCPVSSALKKDKKIAYLPADKSRN